MQRTISIVILYAAPVVLTIGVCILAMLIHLLLKGFGSHRGAGPLVLAGIGVWVLHMGYVLGPWLYGHERQGLALVLMLPVALAGGTCAMWLTSRLVPENGGAGDGWFAACCVLWMVSMLGAYIAPIVVMVLSRGAPTAA
ncbi:MAG TPA: hypothetical protein VK176_07800 [Phycisphaerales bacterium]|nr:hypothetical protein [Phycisphaerales bacterium]